MGIQLLTLTLAQIVQPIIEVSGFVLNQLPQPPTALLTSLLGVSLLCQLLLLYYIKSPLKFFLKAQHNFVVPYVLTGVSMYFNYQLYVVLPSLSQEVGAALQNMGLFFRVATYCLACTIEYYTLPSYIIFQFSVVIWIIVEAVQTMGVIVFAYQIKDANYADEWKDIGIALLGFLIGTALVVSDGLKKTFEENEQRKDKKDDDHKKDLQVELT